MSEAGQKIIQGLRDAIAGDFSAVTIDGERWINFDPRAFPTVEQIEKGAETLREWNYAGRVMRPWKALPESRKQTWLFQAAAVLCSLNSEPS